MTITHADIPRPISQEDGRGKPEERIATVTVGSEANLDKLFSDHGGNLRQSGMEMLAERDLSLRVVDQFFSATEVKILLDNYRRFNPQIGNVADLRRLLERAS